MIFFGKNNSSGRQEAFTLVELIITIAVFTIGIMAAFTLALANFNENRSNRDRIIAANLAREALEIVRNIRDSNWLAADSNQTVEIGGEDFIVPWNYGALNKLFLVVDYDIYSRGSEICQGFPDPGNILACFNQCKGQNECPLFIDQNGFYSHDLGSPGSLNARTNFSRLVRLMPICLERDWDGNLPFPEEIEREECQSDEVVIGLRVTAVVDWSRAGKEYNLELNDRIYNWRR
ncbi:MAG: type II secretion system protein [Patescibacteria group bacterium]|nr:type II secretion system protein [Patescibacteria group bacterium]